MAEISAGNGPSKYQIHITGNNLSKSILNRHIGKKNKVLIISDEGVPKKHINMIKNLINNKNKHLLILEQGEKSKSFSSYNKILKKLFDLNFDRSDCLIALGGGVVGDMGGFVASTFKRGIDFINVHTTLLAMVDASIGGKTGVDLGVLKNLVGTFNNPKMVIIDPLFLNTQGPIQV